MYVGSKTLFNPVFIKPEQVHHFLPCNYTAITYWPDEEICHHLDVNLILTEKQRACWKRSRGTRDIAMGWIDYRNAFDIIPPLVDFEI